MKKLLFFLSSLFICSGFIGAANAATFGFDALSQKPSVGQRFEVSVFLNTESERVNAIEGSVVLPLGSVSLKEIRDGNSIVPLWVEPPHFEESDKIVFSGVIPGGYNGIKGHLFSFVLRGNAEASGAISLSGLKAFLHDGEGTQANVKGSNFSFTIFEGIASDMLVSPADTVPPESFTPTALR